MAGALLRGDPVALLTAANLAGETKRPRLDRETRALGALRPVPWGTSRVTRATGPLRYAAPPWARSLPGAATHHGKQKKAIKKTN